MNKPAEKVYSNGCLYYQHALCRGTALTVQTQAAVSCCCNCHQSKP